VASDPARPGSLTARFAATRRVLVIEDDPDIAEFLRAYFRASGYDFVHADPVDAADGLAAIERHQPDCVLLDIGLRGFSGLEIYRRARGVTALALTPIVVVTADATVRTRTDATAAGIDGFVSKPFNVNTLAEVVAQRIEAATHLGESGVVEEGSEVLTTAVLDARLADEIDLAQASGAPLTFGIISLPTLRGLPGRAGEEARSWLLRALVGEARPLLPPEVALARTSTDELAVVAPACTPAEAAEWLERILEHLRGRRTLPGGEEVVLEPTAGLAGYPEHALDPDGLYMCADSALADARDGRRLVAVAL
jgi:CheY-like chemotaxis protein